MLPDGLATLSALGVSESLIADLRSFLEDSAGQVVKSAPDEVGTRAFGAAPASQQCASDASKARRHVEEALEAMSTALSGYGQIIVTLRETTTAIDDATEVDLSRQAAQANACVVPAFAAAPPTQCLPAESSEGDS